MNIQEAQTKIKTLSDEQDKIFINLRNQLKLAEDDDLADWLFDTIYNGGDIAKFEEQYKAKIS